MRVQHRRPRLRLVCATAVAALVVDVVTKAIAVGVLVPGPLRGAVVDFVAIGWGPIFNAADVCVVVGVAILTWRLLADGRGPASA
jgi:lipoprotein signal peptidase